MKKIILILSLIWLASWSSFAQNSEVDSLRNVLELATHDTTRAEVCRLISWTFSSINLDSSIVYAHKQLQYATNADWKKKIANAHFILGQFYRSTYQNGKSVEHFQKANAQFKKLDGFEWDIAKTHGYLITIYGRLGNLEEALKHRDSTLMYFDEENHKEIAEIENRVGILFAMNENYSMALKYFQYALNQVNKTDDWEGKGFNTMNIGKLYGLIEQPDSCIYYLKLALELAEEHDLVYVKRQTVFNIGIHYTTIEAYETALSWLLDAENMYLEASQEHATSEIKGNIARAYLGLEDFEKAVIYGEQALELMRVAQQTNTESEFLPILAKAYFLNKNFQKAYTSLEASQVMRDSFLSKENRLTITKLEQEYKVAEQQAKLDLKEAEVKRQRFIIQSISVGIVLMLSLIILVFRMAKQRKKTNQQLQQLDRAKSRFFANISHELRTPLTLILAPIESAIQKVKSKPAKENLQLAHRNSKKILRLVNEILDLSKLESGKMQLNESPVMLEKLLRRIFFSYHSLAQLRDFMLSFSYHLPKDLAVQLDIEKFEKVLNNLLSNAFKHSQAGGAITLRTSQQNGNLQIEVQDTGKGIPPEQLEKIFERFYQIEDETEPLQGGTGIGLAYAKEIALLFGGDLKVESEVHKGSNFIFQLPLKKASLNPLLETKEAILAEDFPKQTVPIPDIFNGKPNILVVEDNPEMSKFLVQTLSSQYNCKVAHDGQIALDLLKTEKFDLITSDVMMPNMDGFTFLKQVHAHETHRQTPVILLTARALAEDKLRGLHLGVDDYITKPFNINELLARISNLLKNKTLREDFQEEESIAVGEETPLTFEQELLKKAEHTVQENMNNPNFKIADLAQAVNYSQRQLTRIIRKQTGLTPVGFVREIRLQKAWQLLESRQFATIAEVHYAVGMENASYFTKKFLERFGQRPSEV